MEFGGAQIRKIRKDRGLSLADFAQKIGISTSYLSEIERGKKKPSLKTLNKIASTFNINKYNLLQQNGDNEERDKRPLKLGEKIRLVREEKGLKLEEAAQKIGISTSYLSEIERGNVNPSIEILKEIANTFEVSLNIFLGKETSLGTKIRKIREAQGMTQSGLAKASGVSPGLIGQIEQGRIRPSLKTLEKISHALGVSPCYFILEEDDAKDMLQLMNPEVLRLLNDPNVQSVLRQICDCSNEEIKFILEFIKLYKRSNYYS